ncbi:SEN34 subunit of tRNA-splicing endonuclease [Xylariaceae sp. FL0255]|nr:SEN34 subunit of tRNA-splicing endonuclease [Xylariaceae sp. FL0255]
MAASTPNRPLVRISTLSGRYLLFDIDDVMYLRRSHNICSAFVGTIPQNPQQNVFLGSPLELTPEEAQVLVDKQVAYVADDAAFHSSGLGVMNHLSRQDHIQSLKTLGKNLQLAVIETQSKIAEEKKKSAPKKKKGKHERLKDTVAAATSQALVPEQGDTDIFDTPLPATEKQFSKPAREIEGYVLTPTTSDFLLKHSLKPGYGTEPSVLVDLPVSYPLFAHLHDKGYCMMPGLRFGCDYNVYPGDPLRFHSHFAAVHFRWDEEITMLDLIGGGRLGTSVKKGFLFGGAAPNEPGTALKAVNEGAHEVHSDDSGAPKNTIVGSSVRAFCLEWAGM